MNAKDRNILMTGALVLALAAIGVAAWLLRPTGPAEVSASDGGFAAGRDITVGRDVIVNEYDQDEARRRATDRFIATWSRYCGEYLDSARNMAITDRPTGELPNLIGYLYSTEPDLSQLVGLEAYDALNEQQTKLQALAGEITQLQLMNLMAGYRDAMGRSGAAAATDDVPGDFAAKKRQLLTLTQSHCDYLRKLRPA